ncbi:hypothetical protein GOODEAATRI_022348, partial [Goodea atripinnis]
CYLWKDVPQTSQSSNDKIMIPPSCNLNMDIRQSGLSKGSLPWVSQLPDHLRDPNYCLSVNR